MRVIPEKEMFLIFINIEIVGKLLYTDSPQPETSLKSKLHLRYLTFAFFARTTILRNT